MSALPEPTSRDKTQAPQPDAEPTEVDWTSDAVLAQARALACKFDPQHAATFAGMSDRRWVQSVYLGANLLTAHAAYRLHHSRGRGRRQHAAEVHALLDETNAANLVAALSLILVMGRILNRSPRGA